MSVSSVLCSTGQPSLVAARAATICAVLAALAITTTACSRPDPDAAKTLNARIAAACNEPSVVNALRLARARFPDSLPSEEWRKDRNLFLSDHRWELFDNNHDGFLNVEEYISSEWAGYLAQIPGQSCVVTRMDYMNSFLGPPDEIESGWKNHWSVSIFSDLYEKLDVNHRGFITKDDLRQHATLAFKSMNQSHTGLLSPEEMHGRPR